MKMNVLFYHNNILALFFLFKYISNETYKNLLICSYKRDVVYVKKPSRKSSKKSKTYKE